MKKEIPTGKQVTQKMYVHAYDYTKDGVCLMASDMSDHGYICLGAVEIEYKVPNVNVVNKAVESLEKQIERERAEHHVKISGLQEKIQSLLAISFDGEQ